jgi:hypothetical protein
VDDFGLADLTGIGDPGQLRARAEAATAGLEVDSRSDASQEGADASDSVWVTMTPDGAVADVSISRRWTERLADDRLGEAVLSAYRQADGKRTLTRARGDRNDADDRYDPGMPDVDDQRANGDLRSALWRLRRITGVLREDNHRLSLSPQVAVDVMEMTGLCGSLIVEAAQPALRRLPELVEAHSILPGWDEDWLVIERERYRLARLRALERSAEALLAGGQLSAALDAALAAVDTDPFRESAHRLSVRIHLAEGNQAEAIRAYLGYRTLVAGELGIAPSPLMDALVAPFGATSQLARAVARSAL